MALTRLTELSDADPLTGEEVLLVSQLDASVVRESNDLFVTWADNSINDPDGQFISSGFAVGDQVNIAGDFVFLSNNKFSTNIVSLTPNKMIISDLFSSDEEPGPLIKIQKWQSRRLSTTELVVSGTNQDISGDKTFTGSVSIRNAEGGTPEPTLVLGGQASGLVDGVDKFAWVNAPHFDNDEENIALLSVQNTVDENMLSFGGDDSAPLATKYRNAATSIRFYVGPTSTTLGGTLALEITDAAVNIERPLLVEGSVVVTDTDPRLTDAREWTAETVSQAEAEAGASTERRAWTAERINQAIQALAPGGGGGGTTVGNALYNLANPSAITFLRVNADNTVTARSDSEFRGDLGLAYGSTAGTVTEGNDARLSDSREWTAATVDQTEAETGTETTRRAWTAERVRQAVLAVTGAIGTTVGRALFSLTNPSAISFLRVNADNTVTARSATDFRSDIGANSATNLTTGTLPAARFNDTAHGNRAGGTLHAAASGSANGFMSSADFTKLAGVATAATANQTDAFLLSRANHTGTQLMSTISNAGAAAVLNVGTTAGTVAAGDDSRLTNSREWTASTVTQVDAEAGTSTTRTAWTAQRVRQAILAVTGAVGTTVGRALFALTNPSAVRFLRINADNTVTARTDSEMRTDLGLGTIATQAASAVAITGGTVAVNAGTVSAPGISIAGDANTGIYQSAADTLDITTNGENKASFGLRDLAFNGGDRIALVNNDKAGSITLTGGDIDPSSAVNGIGGDVNLVGGLGQRIAGIQSVVRGGSINLLGGEVHAGPTGIGKGGSIFIKGGTSRETAGGDSLIYSGEVQQSTTAHFATGYVQVGSFPGASVQDGSTINYPSHSGEVILVSGSGGQTNTTGSIAAGNSGNVSVRSSNGGSALAGTANGGNAGSVTIGAGAGGASVGGTPGNNGSVIFQVANTTKMSVTTTKVTAAVPFELPNYAKASLPTGMLAGAFIFVTDDVGGSTPAFFDGTNWRRVADRAIVS